MTKSEELIEITPGYYKHYKGNIYKVIGMAYHSETLEQMVIYQAVYGNNDLWVRPASMWDDIIHFQGKEIKRFTKIDFCE